MGLRIWRRVRIAPGVTVNISKSGPSLSVGPHGLRETFGPRGRRTTLGIPGTGIFYTTTSRTARPSAGASAPRDQAGPELVGGPLVAGSPGDPGAVVGEGPLPAELEQASKPPAGGVDYGVMVVLAVVLAVGLVALGTPAGTALWSGLVVVVVGCAYEWLAHHHPTAAKRLVAVAAGLVTVATALAAALFVGALAAAAVSGRRR